MMSLLRNLKQVTQCRRPNLNCIKKSHLFLGSASTHLTPGTCPSHQSSFQVITTRQNYSNGHKIDSYSHGDDAGNDLNYKTQHWLRSSGTGKGWTMKDTNVARSLIEQWMLSSNKHQHKKADMTIKIYHKWLTSTELYSEKNYSMFIEYLNRILSVCKQCTVRPEKALRVFTLTLEKANKSSNSSLIPQDKTFSSLFDLFALSPSEKTMDSAREILSERLSIPQMPAPDLQFWNSFLNLLAKHSSFDPTIVEEAEEILDALQHQADERTIAHVLDAWVHSRRPEAGERSQFHLNRMIQSGKLNTVCFNLTIEAWSVSGNPEKAEACLNHMLELRRRFPATLDPDARSFLPVVRGWCNADQPDRAEKVIDAMQIISEELGKSTFHQTPEVLVALLQAWAKRGDATKVDKLLRASIHRFIHEESESGRSWVSPQAFTVAIRAWAMGNDPNAPERAEELLTEMEKLSQMGFQSLSPNHYHYSALLSVLASASRIDVPSRAIWILDRCNTELGPNLDVYNSVLFVLAKHGMTEEAEEIFAEMKRHGAHITPDSVSYTNLIRAHLSRGPPNAVSRSMELLREFELLFDDKLTSERPSEAMYLATMMAQSFESADDAERVWWNVVCRYKNNARCIPPTLKLYNKVLQLWSRSNDGRAPERTEALLSWAEGSDAIGRLRPDEQSYLHTIRSWAKSGRRIAPYRIENLLQHLQDCSYIEFSRAFIDDVEKAVALCGKTPLIENHLKEMCKRLI